MKILVDARELHRYRAGIGRYIFNLFEDISRINCRHTFGSVIMQGASESLPPVMKNERLETGWSKWNRLIRPLWDNYLIPRYFKKNRFDLFYSAGHCAPVLDKSVPYAATIYDLTPFLFKQAFPRHIGEYIRFNLRMIAKQARMISVLSENTKADLMNILNVPSDKIRVIHPSLLLPELDRRKRIDIPNLHKFILSVGTNEPRKNLLGLLKAYGRLDSELRREYPLVITGKVGWKSEDLKAIIEELKISDNIITPGFVEESVLIQLFIDASLFCYPSLYEGFGFPPLEAMHYGAPVLTSNVSSLPEVTGDAAILVNPYDIDDITDKITMILSNKDLRNDLRIKGKIQAAKFVDNGFGRKMLELFDEAIS